MKKLLLLASFLGLTASVFAQGTVNFGNTSGTLFTTNNGTTSGNVSGATGAYHYELLVGAPGATDLSTFTVIGTITNSSTLAGRFFGGTQTNSSVGAGGGFAVAVRAWLADSVNALDYASSTFKTQTIQVLQLASSGNPTSSPPGTPSAIYGAGLLSGAVLTPVVPEPSSIALGLLGLGAVALFRRRK